MSLEAQRESRATAARALEVARLEQERARLQSQVLLLSSRAAPVEQARADIHTDPAQRLYKKVQRGLLVFALKQRKKVGWSHSHRAL